MYIKNIILYLRYNKWRMQRFTLNFQTKAQIFSLTAQSMQYKTRSFHLCTYSGYVSSITIQRFLGWLGKRRAFSIIDIQPVGCTHMRTKNQHGQRFDIGVKQNKYRYWGTADITYIRVIQHAYILWVSIFFCLNRTHNIIHLDYDEMNNKKKNINKT